MDTKNEVNIFTSVLFGITRNWKTHNICFPLWQVYELYSQVSIKCPLYGTSYIAVHGQDSLILLCRTKVSEILHWFIHQALTPPHLCNPAYYQRNSVARKTIENTRHSKCKLHCRVHPTMCWNALQSPFVGHNLEKKPVLHIRSLGSMFRSTIAPDCPTTSLLTFQEINTDHDIHPDWWKSTVSTPSPAHECLSRRHWNDINHKGPPSSRRQCRLRGWGSQLASAPALTELAPNRRCPVLRTPGRRGGSVLSSASAAPPQEPGGKEGGEGKKGKQKEKGEGRKKMGESTFLHFSKTKNVRKQM